MERSTIMKIGTITLLVLLAFFALSSAAYAEGEIYKIVNPDGSITFTDQKPAPGAEPVQLKPLSVVETETPPAPAAPATASAPASTEPTERDLRRMYSDFSITQPQNEETFWGTATQVTGSWGSSQALQDGMRVVLYVNGEAQEAAAGSSLTLQLDRGEHQVYAVLRDAGNRRIAATDTVTFFVKQHSANF
jgi:hypothetical protein